MIGLIMLSGGVFLEHQKYTQIYFNVGVVSIGAFVVIVSLIGACGAHRESKALLRLYTVVLALLLVAVFGVTREPALSRTAPPASAHEAAPPARGTAGAMRADAGVRAAPFFAS